MRLPGRVSEIVDASKRNEEVALFACFARLALLSSLIERTIDEQKLFFLLLGNCFFPPISFFLCMKVFLSSPFSSPLV